MTGVSLHSFKFHSDKRELVVQNNKQLALIQLKMQCWLTQIQYTHKDEFGRKMRVGLAVLGSSWCYDMLYFSRQRIN